MKCFFFKRKSKSDPALNHKKKKNHAKKSTSAHSSPRSIKELYKEKEHNFRVFTVRELINATNGFNKVLKIGEGGFGKVYRGTITPEKGIGNSIVVAIKKLNTRGFQVYTHTCFSRLFAVLSELVEYWLS
jgi:aspartate oxidase